VPPAVAFLQSLAQSLAMLSLYPEGHATRERSLDQVFGRLDDLLQQDPRPIFSFLGDEVVHSDHPLRELREWPWSSRLASIGVQRLELDRTVTRDALEGFLDHVLERLQSGSLGTSHAQPTSPGGIRYGEIGVDGAQGGATDVRVAGAFTLEDEVEAIRWIHREVQDHENLPLLEAETVIRALAVAMHGDQQVVVPLLRLREFDEYTTTHSMNVAVLAMAMGEWSGLGGADVRTMGVAGLLHDLGKVRIPLDILTKPGKLSPDEREIMNSHPVEGARLILSTEVNMDLAATVAYEHHRMIDGGGYPTVRFPRDAHQASRIVHVCDVYDALRTVRPYRDAWEAERILTYLEERAGTEFDADVAIQFTRMIRAWEPAIVELQRPEDLVPDTGASTAPVPGDGEGTGRPGRAS